ncbi:MAG: transposase [Puniceicoccaceae bacterium]|nr:MAG: transposase [Puniceicoccaceae bacterium]
MRTRRIKVIGQTATYHVITRTVNGQHLFAARDKEILRKMIHKVAYFCGVQVLTFCILSNHLHLLVRVPTIPTYKLEDFQLIDRARRLYGPAKANAIAEILKGTNAPARKDLRDRLLARMFDLSSYVKELKQRISIYYNRTHGRFGTLWAERFKSVLVEGNPFSLQTVASYIDLNPIRAGLATDPKDYRFSGYGEASGGNREARKGIETIMETPNWRTASRDYRMGLYGMGSGPAALGQGATLDVAAARRIIAAGGKLPVSQALLCRVRYFSDGLVIGSRSFVESWFQQNRHHLGVRRKSGARSMQGSDWGGLAVVRNLRRRAIG